MRVKENGKSFGQSRREQGRYGAAAGRIFLEMGRRKEVLFFQIRRDWCETERNGVRRVMGVSN